MFSRLLFLIRFIGILDKYSHPNLFALAVMKILLPWRYKRWVIEIEDIDPMINYFLQEFYTKPSTDKNSYDIIFSTSVIEHDPDDESFIKCVEGLLAPDGIAVITCDYKDGWKPGDPKTGCGCTVLYKI